MVRRNDPPLWMFLPLTPLLPVLMLVCFAVMYVAVLTFATRELALALWRVVRR